MKELHAEFREKEAYYLDDEFRLKHQNKIETMSEYAAKERREIWDILQKKSEVLKVDGRQTIIWRGIKLQKLERGIRVQDVSRDKYGEINNQIIIESILNYLTNGTETK